ncbi:hypothetical protein [Methanoculleus sp.]|uniref:hypothetical protein n=1 Tax=Methanoculleus sp. TaxID=90427 RepID=UPI0025DE09FA|nr:hypothetical protein [Methanoculleus sp.]MCK9319506.1 hypothetical protein [Methanoculleus sp.]
MKKIITYLKRSNIPMIIDHEMEEGTFPSVTITVTNKKKTAILTKSLFTMGDIEVSIETPRSSKPYACKSFNSEAKALNYLFTEGVFQP